MFKSVSMCVDCTYPHTYTNLKYSRICLMIFDMYIYIYIYILYIYGYIYIYRIYDRIKAKSVYVG